MKGPSTNAAEVRSWFAHVRSSDTVRYFIGQSSYLMPLNVLGLTLGLVSTVLYARLLEPSQYGELSYVFATVTLLNFLALPGMITAITQAAAQQCDGFYERATRLRWRTSLAGSIVVAGIGLACWRSKGAEVGVSFLLAAALFPLAWALDGYWSVLNGKKLFGPLAALRLIQMMVVTTATWAGLLLSRRVWVVFAANFGAMALTNVIFHYWTLRRHKANDEFRPEAMGYGKRLSALSVLISIETRVDNVMLGTYLPFATLGWFNMAARINEGVMQETWTVVARLLFPRLAETSGDEARRRARVWGAYLLGGFAVLAALFWLLAPWVLPWVLGPKYAASISLVQWLALITAFTVPWSVFEVYCQARANEKSLWLTRLLATGTHLATLPWFLNLWGVTGVLWSIALSRVAGVALSVVLYRRGTR